MLVPKGLGDLILSAPYANSLISITVRTCTHTNVMTQTLYTLNLTQTKKISNLGPEFLTLVLKQLIAAKEGYPRI